MLHRVSSGARIAAVYAAVATLWVVVSDRAASRLGDLTLVTNVQTGKALLVIGVTAGLLYVIATLRDRLKEENRGLLAELGDRESKLIDIASRRRRFLEALSHELRTPMTAIHGMSLTLSERRSELTPEQVDAFHEAILKNTRRVNAVVLSLIGDEALTEANFDDARKQSDVGSLLRSAASRIDTSRHRVDVGHPDMSALVVPSYVELLVEELIRNVVRHTPPGTQASVEASLQQGNLRIVVADSGPGVPPHLVARIFEPFEQGSVPTHSPGLGVGLTLAGRIARLHGGSLRLESPPEGGARFVVELALPGGSRGIAQQTDEGGPATSSPANA